MNRYALSADNGELLTKGMLLIKAICRNIVSPDARDARAAAAAAEVTGGSGAAAAVTVSPTKPPYHKFYYRGGSLPFEMVSNRSSCMNVRDVRHRRDFFSLERYSGFLSFWPLPAKNMWLSILPLRYHVISSLFV